MKPKKSLGQNFLINKGAVINIADHVLKHDPCLTFEIGPGKGFLTKELLKCKRLIVIEKDDRFIDILEKLGVEKVFNQDIMGFDFESEVNILKIKKISVVGNLPYNISSQILFKLFKDFSRIKNKYNIDVEMVLMFQKEVADRIICLDNSKGGISLLSQAYSNIVKLFNLGPKSFFPAPKVHSSVLKFQLLNKINNYDILEGIIKSLFKYKRKQIKSIYNNYIVDEKIKDVLSPLSESTLRPGDISLDQYLKLLFSLIFLF